MRSTWMDWDDYCLEQERVEVEPDEDMVYDSWRDEEMLWKEG